MTSLPTRLREAATPDSLAPTPPGPAAAAPPADPLDEVRRLVAGQFVVLRPVGRGGMGVVYQAVQKDPGRPVALKVLGPAVPAGPAAAARFRHEAQVAARLHHTHIVPVFATVPGPCGGVVAYAMPFINGHNLAAVLRGLGDPAGWPDGPFRALVRLSAADIKGYQREAVGWARQAAEAVAAAHAAGVVHRDVKPANLLLEFTPAGRPHVWLHDFGLAAAGPDDPWAADADLGTPGYRRPGATAPADRRDPWADLYALGVTLAELVTGRRPTPDDLRADPPRLPGLPAELRRVVAAATAARPDARYPTAAEFAADLGRFLAGYPVQAGRPGWARRLTAWAGRHRRPLLAAAAAGCTAAGVGTALLVRAYSQERDARRAAERREELAAGVAAAYTPAMDDAMLAAPGMADRQREVLEQSRTVYADLLAAHPADWRAEERLAQVEFRLGRALARSGRRAEAAAAQRASAERFERVAAADPGEPLHLLDAARGRFELAALEADPAAAVELTAATVRITAGLCDRFPGDRRFPDARATYLSQHAGALFDAGRAAEAEAVAREALAAAAASRAGSPDWRAVNPVVAARRQLARFAWGLGRTDDALKHTVAALGLNRDRLARCRAEPDPRPLELYGFRMTDVFLVRDLAVWKLASGRDATGHAAELELLARAVARDHPEAAPLAAEAGLLRGWASHRAGSGAAGANRFRRHAEHLAQQLDADPGCAARQAAVARFAAVCPLPDVPDLRRAEDLARKAVAAENAPAHRFALGAVLHRRGDAAGAEAALLTVPEAHPDRRPAELLLTAIAAKAGRADEAQSLLTRATGRPITACPEDFELTRAARDAVAALPRVAE